MNKQRALETLEEYQARRWKEVGELRGLSGIACPACGLEMSRSLERLLSHPPQIEVFCTCGFRERVIA